MKDEQKSAFFRDLLGFDLFQAQLALEQDTYDAFVRDLASLDLKSGAVELEYARIRGAIDALKGLKNARERLANVPRSR